MSSQKSKWHSSWFRWILLPLIWSFVLGSIGYLVGLIAPTIFDPDASLGPLLGIVLTGPVAFLIGIVGGIISALRRLSVRSNVCSLLILSVLVAGVTLFMSLIGPLKAEPYVVGTILDAEIRDCRSPQLLEGKAIARWKEIIALSGQVPKWREMNVPDLLKKDQGVILDLWVYRKLQIIQHRKPWNLGRIEVEDWHTENTLKSFHTEFAGPSCASFIPQQRLYFSKSFFACSSTDTLLGLDILASVSKDYQSLIKKIREQADNGR